MLAGDMDALMEEKSKLNDNIDEAIEMLVKEFGFNDNGILDEIEKERKIKANNKHKGVN